MEKEEVFLAATIVTTIAAVWMLWPYMDALLWAGFTAYFLHYLSDWLNEYIDHRAITTWLLTGLLVTFVSLISYLLLTSVPDLIRFISQFSNILSGGVSLIIDAFNLSPAIADAVRSAITQLTAEGRAILLGLVGKVPSLLINLFLYLVVAVFLLKDGRRLARELMHAVDNIPSPYHDTVKALIVSVDDLFRGVFISYFIVALFVGTLATAGFYLLGVDFYIGWGVIIGIFALIPIVSAPLVYGPLALLYIAIGEFWRGALILFYGILVINTLPEILIRPYVAANTTREHPALLFIGFVIGPLVLGFKGLILGPIILVVAKNMLLMRYFDL